MASACPSALFSQHSDYKAFCHSVSCPGAQGSSLAGSALGRLDLDDAVSNMAKETCIYMAKETYALLWMMR